MRRDTSALLGFFVLLPLALAGCKSDDPPSDSAGADTSGSEGTASDPTTSGSTTTATSTAGPTTDPTSTSTTADTDPDSDSTGDTGSLDCPYTPIDGQPAVRLELVANGFNRPLLVVGHPTEPDRLFVVEQGGTVRILEPGMTEAPADAFLQVAVQSAGSTTLGDERGLLGFALHPDFPNDARVYVAYNPPGGGLTTPMRIEEYAVGNDGKADPASARVVLDVARPDWNHQGGMLAFGPDGYLYIGTGDGGGGGDPYNTGRAKNHILAKILRIGVEPDGQPNSPTACDSCPQLGPFDYTIPDDNPFLADDDFAPEIWAWGFRNPWRFSFDQKTGDMYAADVGQHRREEIDLVVAGADYGWSQMEGFNCYPFVNNCPLTGGPNEVNDEGMTMPLTDYDILQSSRCAVVGLGVYRSCEVSSFDGVYFYGDYCTGEAFGLTWDGQTVTELGLVWSSSDNDRILGGGNNAHGDVFVATATVPFTGAPFDDGRVYRITAAR